MASFKITDLTELTGGSVADTDVLEIVDLDADQSKKVTIASLKTVFSASEGSAYTGGTSNGIMFNDGDTFATSLNFVFDGETLTQTLTNGQTADAFQINSFGNTGGDLFKVTSDGRLLAYEKLVISDVTRSAVFSQSGTQLFLQYSTNDGVTSSSTLSQTRLDQALHALYTRTAIGAYPLTTEQFSVTINDASWTGQSINLANGQTADAFQINSFGNTGGDLFSITADSEVSIGNVAPAIKGLTIETTAGVSNNSGYGIRFNAASGNSAIIYQVTPEVLRFTGSSGSYIELQALKLGQPNSWSIGKPSSSEGITVLGDANTTDTTIVSLEAARGQSNTTDEVRGLRTTWSINPTSGSNNIVDVELGGGLAWSSATGWTGKAIGVLVSPRIGDGTDNSATERILLDVGNNTSNAPNYSSHTSVFKIHTDGRVSLLNLPTSSAGLSSGDLWNDSGTVKIV